MPVAVSRFSRLVAVAGYSVGESQSSRATAVAATSTVAKPDVPAAVPAVSYAGVVNAVTPAVVTVRVDKRGRAVPTQMPQLPDDPMFREFFGRRFQVPQQRTPRQSGLGLGRHHHA